MGVLYKYTAQPNYLFEDGYIRATQLSALNDPFEASYCPKSLMELSRHLEIYLTSEELISQIEKDKNSVGVISFTEAKDNLLMWSHYADEHRGVIVGFLSSATHNISIFENLFKLQMTGSSSFDEYKISSEYPTPVIYRKQPRYKVDRFDFDYSNICVEGTDRILYEIFQQKSDEWIYEKEHRITLRLEQADKVVIHDFEELENSYVYKKIIRAKFHRKSKKNGKYIHTIYLNKITDPITREAYAAELAKLSKNPNNLYLFKLNTSAVCSLLLGIRSNINNFSFKWRLDNQTGFFEAYQSKLNINLYTIDFDEIKLVRKTSADN